MWKYLVGAVAALTLAGCASVDTDYDYDESADFVALKTWAWIESPKAEAGGQYQLDGLNETRIRNALSSQLASLGMKQVPAAEAHVLVNYLTQVEKKIDVDTFYSDFGYYPYSRYRGPAWGVGVHADTRVREYKEGTLIVDIVDAGSKSLVWRGTGTGVLKKNQTPSERTERIQQVVGAIFEGYPLGQEK